MVPQAIDGGELDEVLGFWLGRLDEQGRADEAHARRWWGRDEAFDRLIRERFGPLHAAVAAGERQHWISSPRGHLGAIIVLDQLSRNMFRGTPRMFAYDPKALQIALDGIERRLDRSLALDERGFFYMPLMHSEELAMQQRCVALFRAFCDELEGELRRRVALSLDFAERHRDIIRRFGRFPHRNALLGRASTAEEQEFLLQPGSSF